MKKHVLKISEVISKSEKFELNVNFIIGQFTGKKPRTPNQALEIKILYDKNWSRILHFLPASNAWYLLTVENIQLIKNVFNCKEPLKKWW